MKVGDKVKVITDDSNFTDEVGEVISISLGEVFPIKVLLDNRAWDVNFQPDELEILCE